MKTLILLLIVYTPLNFLNVQAQQWQTFSQFGNTNVVSIEKDTNYTILWMPSFGLNRFNFNTNNLTHYDTSSSTFQATDIYNISINSHIKWICGNRGLFTFNNNNWTKYHPSNSGIASNLIFDAAIDNNGVAWIATGQGLSRFYNNTWKTYNTSNSPLPGNFLFHIETIDNEIWIGTRNTGVVRIIQNSLDTIWRTYNTKNSGLSYDNISDVEIKNNKVYIATEGGGLSIFNRKDSSWSAYFNPGFVTSVAIDSSNTIWMGTPGGGLFEFQIGKDTNNFNPENSPIYWAVNDVAVDSNQNIWIGHSGLTVYNENGIVSIENNISTIKNFELSQNYPNPFNPITNISFNISKSSHVKLEIFDINGKKIETLLNSSFSSGEYKIQWNAVNFASGIYFYKIESGNFIETKRMVLVK